MLGSYCRPRLNRLHQDPKKAQRRLSMACQYLVQLRWVEQTSECVPSGGLPSLSRLSSAILIVSIPIIPAVVLHLHHKCDETRKSHI